MRAAEFALLGLIALVPAAVGAAPVRAALSVPLCGGGSVALSVGRHEVPGAPQPGCCAKGCHTGRSRRKARRMIDRAQ